MTDFFRFDAQQLPLVPMHGQRWFTADVLASALGYATQRSLLNLYNRNADRFDASTTMVVMLDTVYGREMRHQIDDASPEMARRNDDASLEPKATTRRETRVFSFKGALKLATLARTETAERFVDALVERLDAPAGARAAAPAFDPLDPARLLGREERRRANRIRHRLTLIAALRAELAALGVDEGDEDLYGEGAL